MLKFIRLTPDSPEYDDVIGLYVSAFPDDERRPLDDFRTVLAENPFFVAQVVSDGGSFVGFITYWDFPSYRYVEHFAIASSLRGHGYGGDVIEWLKSTTPLPVVLEVEPPTTSQARRRIQFYERHGFVLSDYAYEQPPYCPGAGSLPMRLMVARGEVLGQFTAATLEPIYHFVYRVASK